MSKKELLLTKLRAEFGRARTIIFSKHAACNSVSCLNFYTYKGKQPIKMRDCRLAREEIM